MTHSQSDFAGQFRITTNEEAAPEGSCRWQFGDLKIDIFKPLSKIDVSDKSGRRIGILLGLVIDTDSRSLVSEEYVIDAHIDEYTDIDDLVEKYFYRLAGSFALIIATDSVRRLYLDANGTKSVVYDADARVAASTAALAILDASSYSRRLNMSLRRALQVDGEGWLPAGLTAHEGLERLTCNHFLDLDRWLPVRHWPRREIVRDEAAQPALDVILDEIHRTIETLTTDGEIYIALTAGYDSRLILAGSRKLLDRICFVTVDAPGSHLDCQRAREMARRFGLKHRILPYIEANADQIDIWQRRVSHSVSGANLKLHPSVKPLERKIFVGGAGGEIGRGLLWLGSTDSTKLDAEGIIERLKLPWNQILIDRINVWLKDLEGFNSLFVLDLAYMELHVSSWSFTQAYTLPHSRQVNPLISRRIYSAMLSVPVSSRRNNGLAVEGIRLAWPELLEFPFNRFGDWRDPYAKIYSAIRDPGRAWRKVRQVGGATLVNTVNRIGLTVPAFGGLAL